MQIFYARETAFSQFFLDYINNVKFGDGGGDTANSIMPSGAFTMSMEIGLKVKSARFGANGLEWIQKMDCIDIDKGFPS